ncbi:hypothetical protein LTR36_010410 [Oleoguttula mirabilis]|uniref:Exonuclease domain-containing protein n=1 Tax=Oleoguttula mirabilis TaxID=1507867 RepID=A0AAV9J4Y6_9PEZI|nr:hypothetical protein LTR36_010410 [Oleoguttula mirabilis]
MSATQPLFRGLALVSSDQVYRDHKGHWVVVNTSPLSDRRLVTPAKQTTPNLANLTRIVALDAEFQLAYVAALAKHIQRIGRLSAVNYFGHIIYDVFFAYYPEQDGYITEAPAEISAAGTCYVAEVEYNLRKILQGRLVVGHSIYNDIGVCSPGVFEGVETRDTQLFSKYREFYYRPIQGEEHSSAEDGAATIALYREHEAEIEREQGGGEQADSMTEEGAEQGWFDEYVDELEAEPDTDQDPPEDAIATPEAGKATTPDVVSAAALFWQSSIASVKAAPFTRKSAVVATKPAALEVAKLSKAEVAFRSPPTSLDTPPADSAKIATTAFTTTATALHPIATPGPAQGKKAGRGSLRSSRDTSIARAVATTIQPAHLASHHAPLPRSPSATAAPAPKKKTSTLPSGAAKRSGKLVLKKMK